MSYNEPILVRIINVVLSVVQIILCLHIVLKLFGAAMVPFVRWVYQLSHPLLEPFVGIFRDVEFGSRYTLDLSAIFALIVYSALGFLLIKLATVITGGFRNK